MARALTLGGAVLCTVLATLAGCVDEDTRISLTGSSDDSLPKAVVVGTSGDGEQLFALRIDGGLSGSFLADLGLGEPCPVILTGRQSGADQGSIIVLDSHGEVLARHRVGQETPRGHRMLNPNAQHFEPVDVDGRRIFAICTSGMWVPYSVEVLEFDRDAGLTVLQRFWNPGSINRPLIGDGMVVFPCLNNDFRPEDDELSYPMAVCVLDLSPMLASTDPAGPIEGSAPVSDEKVGSGYLAYYLLPEFTGGDHRNFLSVALEDGRVMARYESGLTYVLDPQTGGVEARAEDDLRGSHEARREADSALPTVEEHVARAAASVRVFRPGR